MYEAKDLSNLRLADQVPDLVHRQIGAALLDLFNVRCGRHFLCSILCEAGSCLPGSSEYKHTSISLWQFLETRALTLSWF